MIRTPEGLTVWPGDFAVVRMGGDAGWAIHQAEELALMVSQNHRLTKRQMGSWEHAIFYAGGPEDLILEAEPAGAKLIPYHYGPPNVMWSTGHKSLDLTPAQRANAMAVARKYEGVGYSFADYGAIALHSLGLKSGWLEDYIKSSGHQICSQLATQCRLDLGSRLFPLTRWDGYVDPLDLALLIERSP